MNKNELIETCGAVLEKCAIGLLVVDKGQFFTNDAFRRFLSEKPFRYLNNDAARFWEEFRSGNIKETITFVDNNQVRHVRVLVIEKGTAAHVAVWDNTAAEQYIWIKSVLDSVEEGIQVVNKDGISVFYNQTFSFLEQMPPSAVLGKHLTEAYDMTEEDSIQLKSMRSGEPVLNQYQVYRTQEGKEVSSVHSTYPIIIENQTWGIYSIAKDVTVLKNLVDLVYSPKAPSNSKDRKDSAPNPSPNIQIIGHSKEVLKSKKLMEKASSSLSNVMLFGETGTGKELFAQHIHYQGLRRNGPFVGVNCAAIPETLLEGILFGTQRGAFTGATDRAGLFEQAESGTLFLDEINSMGLFLQAKLLRAVQERKLRRVGGNREVPVNCRIISSTNTNPIEAIKAGSLRSDLFYRLSVVYIEIPTLRERKDDLMELVQFFLLKYNHLLQKQVTEVDAEVWKAFYGYDWPGNVRELENIIEGALNVVEGSRLTAEELPDYFRNLTEGCTASPGDPEPAIGGTLAEIMDNVEKRIIIQVLDKHNGNITLAAKELGLFRQGLQYRIRKHKI